MTDNKDGYRKLNFACWACEIDQNIRKCTKKRKTKFKSYGTNVRLICTSKIAANMQNYNINDYYTDIYYIFKLHVTLCSNYKHKHNTDILVYVRSCIINRQLLTYYVFYGVIKKRKKY